MLEHKENGIFFRGRKQPIGGWGWGGVFKIGHLQSAVRYQQLQHFENVKRKDGGEDMVCCKIRPRGYKTFFMLKSAGHEILTTHKYENMRNSAFFGIGLV